MRSAGLPVGFRASHFRRARAIATFSQIQGPGSDSQSDAVSEPADQSTPTSSSPLWTRCLPFTASASVDFPARGPPATTTLSGSPGRSALASPESSSFRVERGRCGLQLSLGVCILLFLELLERRLDVL